MPHHEKLPAKHRADAILWLFVIALLLGTAAVSLATAHRSLSLAWHSATTHQPERYTQLYFTDPAHLPAFAPLGKPQVIPFRIVNHEHASKTYTYETQVTIAGKTSAYRGTVTLADGQGADETLGFTIPAARMQAAITVRLVGTGQTLSFRSSS